MSKGKVKYFNDVKGWGFISADQEDRDVYVTFISGRWWWRLFSGG